MIINGRPTRTIKTEFPNYDDRLSFPDGWIDCSWRNDVCPSYEKDFGNTTYKIFCNFKDVNKREIGGLQFHVCTYTKNNNSLESENEFNTLEDALNFVNQKVPA
jgi:hypothetical protein